MSELTQVLTAQPVSAGQDVPTTAAARIVVQTATGHEHQGESGSCLRGDHSRCHRRRQYDDRCVYVCTCPCHTTLAAR